jgi:hypothetical protein
MNLRNASLNSYLRCQHNLMHNGICWQGGSLSLSKQANHNDQKCEQAFGGLLQLKEEMGEFLER